MATTFLINNGDVLIGTNTGIPILIGNELDKDDKAKGKIKAVQDLEGALSTTGIISGASADINNLIGNVPVLGTDTVSILLKRQINQMFASILRLQKQRSGIRPNSELFSLISLLQIFTLSDQVSFRFRLDTLTVDGVTVRKSGQIGG